MAALILLAAVGVGDYVTGYELGFSLFYLVPIVLAAWQNMPLPGIVYSALGLAEWIVANSGFLPEYATPFVFYWNAGVRFGFFLTVALLASSLHRALESERTLSRYDFLTGAANGRWFAESVQQEIARTNRSSRPFIVAYIDLDDFKSVNDNYGHSAGDTLLRQVVTVMRSSLRAVDTVARLGGDEFALLLPETDLAAARNVITKLRNTLLREMEKSNWPVTFSIGVVPCTDAGCTTDSLIRTADNLMYEVKRSGKNNVAYSTPDDLPPSRAAADF